MEVGMAWIRLIVTNVLLLLILLASGACSKDQDKPVQSGQASQQDQTVQQAKPAQPTQQAKPAQPEPTPQGQPSEPTPRTQSSMQSLCYEQFDVMDTNHDSLVSKEEFTLTAASGRNVDRMFAMRDSDGDGTVTRDEFCRARGAGPGAKNAPMGRGNPQMRCQERFDFMDKDDDGLVSKDEFTAVLHGGAKVDTLFTARDSDGSATLTMDELCRNKGAGMGQNPTSRPQ
jgi:Ca2+-binding EF-hand superfamily protein